MNRKRKRAFDDIFDSNRKHRTRTRFAEPLLSDPSHSANLTFSGSSSQVSPSVAAPSSSQIPPPESLSALQTTSSFQPFAICGTSTNRTFTEVFKGRIQPTTPVRSSMSSVEHSTTSGYTIGADHDYGLSVMASAVLNGAVAFGSRSPVAIEEEDLDPLVTLIQDAVTNMNTDTMSTDTDTPDIPDTDTTMTGTTSVTTTNYEFKHLFDSAATQNRTIHQALRRIQSHRVELQDRLTLVQNLSPDHDTAAVQEILLRVERAVKPMPRAPIPPLGIPKIHWLL
ncbi:MAG: hypothetical protein NXY57DRAFT_967931 [Lentinula lateritia]|nr:MAG: hypothetical protein NXY57DRAFT_967931 [Lentinula lateritia]